MDGFVEYPEPEETIVTDAIFPEIATAFADAVIADAVAMVTIGAVVYPVPASVISTDAIEPFDVFAFAPAFP